MILRNFALENILFKISYELEFRIHDILWRAKDKEIYTISYYTIILIEYNDLISQQKEKYSESGSKVMRKFFTFTKRIMIKFREKDSTTREREYHFDFFHIMIISFWQNSRIILSMINYLESDNRSKSITK